MHQPQVLSTRDDATAWGLPTRGEPRWPASLAVVAAVGLYVLLPDRLALPLGPSTLWPLERWILPALEIALLLPLTLTVPRRRHTEPAWARVAAVALIAVINLANIISLVLLVTSLLAGSAVTARDLFFTSLNIWLTNVLVFALWYWELDRGGPHARSSPRHRQPDFLFPQMVTPGCTRPGWTPRFLDYLYVSFTNASAFSPTDTLPLTGWAKGLMLAQALASLLTVALVAARAVNIMR